MDLTFAVFALLPLALVSFVQRARGTYAGFGFLAALAPMLISGVQSLIKHKQQSNDEKKQASYEQQLAQQQEEQRKAAFEAQQSSPQAQMQRMGFNMKLGRLLGAMGGRDKVPPSLLKAYDAARSAPTYMPGSSYVPKPSSSHGIWDFASGLSDALGYLDTSKFGKPKVPGQNIVPTDLPTPGLPQPPKPLDLIGDNLTRTQFPQ